MTASMAPRLWNFLLLLLLRRLLVLACPVTFDPHAVIVSKRGSQVRPPPRTYGVLSGLKPARSLVIRSLDGRVSTEGGRASSG
ncbi:uncharacterized protein B0I36DRAFT_75429 [Microdochium trichocladiopsis]|uniref:Secreted protein n=1 Tax=Microdochium trichocladiopsis TaxID=1682393 RepID=A0A9P8YH85_9PEZI|nr:uncharacterized protein B0I36DRAFT_75429 [Microdochium trichocladiopsis]KAH7038100.1 hypothetical protein B0I36DRAFT_75429 [Microdochium trichocladiopsis]